jgi:hypothetical protein
LEASSLPEEIPFPLASMIEFVLWILGLIAERYLAILNVVGEEPIREVSTGAPVNVKIMFQAERYFKLCSSLVHMW